MLLMDHLEIFYSFKSFGDLVSQTLISQVSTGNGSFKNISLGNLIIRTEATLLLRNNKKKENKSLIEFKFLKRQRKLVNGMP